MGMDRNVQQFFHRQQVMISRGPVKIHTIHQHQHVRTGPVDLPYVILDARFHRQNQTGWGWFQVSANVNTGSVIGTQYIPDAGKQYFFGGTIKKSVQFVEHLPGYVDEYFPQAIGTDDIEQVLALQIILDPHMGIFPGGQPEALIEYVQVEYG